MILTQFAALARRLRAAVSVSILVSLTGLFASASPVLAQKLPVAPVTPRWMNVPNVAEHLRAPDIGLVINTADPYSVAVGEHYIKARGLLSSQVLRIELPVANALSGEDFTKLNAAIDARFDNRIQALALAWKAPFAVGCNAITGALTLGQDESQCANTCRPGKLSPYFNAAVARPYTALRMRLSMLLAAKDVDGAIAMIDRGVRSDRSLAFRGGQPVHAYYLKTSDPNRSARAPLFPPAGFVRQVGIDVHVDQADSLDSPKRVLLYETGLVSVPKLDQIEWVPGALADHLTSFGGVLSNDMGQMSALEWIASGATATYGTVSEPCAHPQKFPHPQIVLLNYVQGATAIEAYWRSVAWPVQGLFIGEPLAAPYAR